METLGIESLLAGAVTTLGLAVLAIVVGLVLGLALGILRWLRLPGLGRLLALYISVVRATPLLTLALVVFFLVPAATGYDMPASLAAIIAMSVNTSAFNCEIWRAGLENFPREQIEAARAAGMHRGLLLRRIMLPQVARSNLPPLVNEMTVLIKNSPAISVIGIVDLTRAAVRIGADTYRPLPPLIGALLIYIVIVFGLLRLQKYLEHKSAVRYAR
ncbi:amino acid ABC transporter permease [Paraburkholderia xenovorans]|uniref:amino acid ABC transporter permease n=1 Tax=Paraburkholderia xenovorans TaxID=36873 RepID=UPI0038B8CC05